MEKSIKEKNFMREATMLKHAKQALLQSNDWLKANDIHQFTGLNTENIDTQLNQWIKQQILFSIRHEGIEYYPIYALDMNHGYRPLPLICEIIKIFSKKYDGWKLAFWFNTNNSYLGGKCPKDLILQEPDLVIHAAKVQAESIQHG